MGGVEYDHQVVAYACFIRFRSWELDSEFIRTQVFIVDENYRGQRVGKLLLNTIENFAKEHQIELEVFQSNHEGAIIDRIQEAYLDGTEGLLINPGAYTHYSYAIRDALTSIRFKKVEVHISNIEEREDFRKISVTKDACDYQIFGQGLKGYLLGLEYLLKNS